MDVKKLLNLVGEGKVVTLSNKNYTSLKLYGIGKKLKTKINVNLGAEAGVDFLTLHCGVNRRGIFIFYDVNFI